MLFNLIVWMKYYQIPFIIDWLILRVFLTKYEEVLLCFVCRVYDYQKVCKIRDQKRTIVRMTSWNLIY